MKTFALRTLLTVTTGRLLTGENGIGDLCELLGWMTNDSPMTHQLGRFGEECKPWLLRWFPELAEAEKHLTEDSGPNSLDYAIRCVKASGNNVEHAINNWLELCIADWGMKRKYDVERIPAEKRGGSSGSVEDFAFTSEGLVFAGEDVGCRKDARNELNPRAVYTIFPPAFFNHQ